jgi:hypothetical protein
MLIVYLCRSLNREVNSLVNEFTIQSGGSSLEAAVEAAVVRDASPS